MIKIVIHFRNGMVMVFDKEGQQMSNYQGLYPDVKDKILKNSSPKTRFYTQGTLHTGDRRYVSKENF